jgi:hypothetical protein
MRIAHEIQTGEPSRPAGLSVPRDTGRDEVLRDPARIGATARTPQRAAVEAGDHGRADVQVIERCELGVQRNPAPPAAPHPAQLAVETRDRQPEERARHR